MNQPKPNTVLWWLLRIEDKELRERAVRACKHPDGYANYLEDAICNMGLWEDTNEFTEFWLHIAVDALNNLIPLLPVPEYPIGNIHQNPELLNNKEK